MKICFLGEYSGDLDEGMRKVSHNLARQLEKKHQVLTMDLRDVLSINFWKSIKTFNPDIIHYVHGPSLKSLFLLKIISLYVQDNKTLLSALHPNLSVLSKIFIPLLKPNIVLYLSLKTKMIFDGDGIITKFAPCGIDIGRYKPISSKTKEKLRMKYNIDKDKFIILHVGSIKKGRNIQWMEKLQDQNNQVIIVASTSTGIENNILRQLETRGCKIVKEYIENIEEIYALSDCYVFPTLPESKLNSIEMPLSVLEAMACNLPIITTKFGALPDVFKDTDGLFFIDAEKDLCESIKKIKEENISIKTRERVLLYSWERIGIQLENIYSGILRGEIN